MTLASQRIVVATYNVLADAYVRPVRYPRTDPATMVREHRYPRLVDRIAGLRNADVICLQEADYALFGLVEKQLRPLGYQGRWVHKGRGKPDGCATFVRKTWAVLETRVLDYSDAHVSGAADGHIALITTMAQDGWTVTAANTHIKWDPPGTPAEKQLGLAQATELLHTIGRQPFAIVCGDFNAEDGSELIKAFAAADFSDAHDRGVATANPGGRAKKIDYIMCQKSFAPHPLPTSTVTDATPLPSETEPSDHVPLIAALVRNDGA